MQSSKKIHAWAQMQVPLFHLGRYIVGYTFGNHVLRLRLRVAVKLNFRPYIRRYTSPNENFEYSYPLSKVQGLSSIMKVSVSEPFAYWVFCQYTKIAFSVKPRTTA